MKAMKALAVALALLVLAVPFAAAEQASAEMQSESKVSVTGLKLKRLGEAFDDFTFKVKKWLTFDHKAKVELIKERNEDMKERQKAWLETKSRALAQFRSSNLSDEEKKQILDVIHSEHQAIIKSHLDATAEIRRIQLEAKARNDASLESEAESEAESAEKSGLSIGLGKVIVLGTKGNLTEAEAEAMVERQLGIESSGVETKVEGNSTFYVFTGEKTEQAGLYTMEKSYIVWVDASSGIVSRVDLSAHLEAEAEELAEAEVVAESRNSGNKAEAKAESKVRVRI